jgi:hypothetical protein
LERPKRAVQKASWAEVHPWLAADAHGNNQAKKQTLLFSKSGCLSELCCIYWHLLRASTERVQLNKSESGKGRVQPSVKPREENTKAYTS